MLYRVASSTSLAMCCRFPTQYVLPSSFNSLNPLQSSQPYATTTVSSSRTGWIYSSGPIPLVQSFSYSQYRFGTWSTGQQFQGTHANSSSLLAHRILWLRFFSSGHLLIPFLRTEFQCLPTAHLVHACLFFLWPQSVLKFASISPVLFLVVNMSTSICCCH